MTTVTMFVNRPAAFGSIAAGYVASREPTTRHVSEAVLASLTFDRRQ